MAYKDSKIYMKIEINRNLLIIALITIAIIGIGYYCLSKYTQSNYEKNAKELKKNIQISGNISSMILQDYSKNWSSAIFDNKAQNDNGEWNYCSDFNTAISWRHSYFDKMGGFLALDTLSIMMSKEISAMTTTPSKYKDCQKAFIEAYNAVTEMVNLCKLPEGSYQDFGNNISRLYSIYTTKIGETDIYLPKTSDEELTNKFDEIINKSRTRLSKQKEIELNKNSNYLEGKNFLELNKKKRDVITLKSGLQYKILVNGTGVKPTCTSEVKVNYEGRLIDGTIFDSSYKRNKPATIRCDQVLRGWTEALTQMPVGSTWEIYIPQELAYGEREAGAIKPYSVLIFKVELLKIEK